MKGNQKNKSCHTGHGGHKGHGWMMLLCMAVMLGGPLLFLLSSNQSLNLSVLGTALLPLILCLVMHGAMMKMLMPGNKKEEQSDSQPQPESEPKRLEYKPDTDNNFNA